MHLHFAPLMMPFQDRRSEAANLEKYPRRSEAVTKDEIFVTFTPLDLEICFAFKDALIIIPVIDGTRHVLSMGVVTRNVALTNLMT
jgi:hypothetical protein